MNHQLNILTDARTILLENGISPLAINKCILRVENNSTLHGIIELAAQFYNVKTEEVKGPDRNSNTESCQARSLAIYFIKKIYPRMSLRYIADVFGIQGTQRHSAISKILKNTREELVIYEATRKEFTRFEIIISNGKT